MTVVVTNAWGAVTSQVATLFFAPSITTQPDSRTTIVLGRKSAARLRLSACLGSRPAATNRAGREPLSPPFGDGFGFCLKRRWEARLFFHVTMQSAKPVHGVGQRLFRRSLWEAKLAHRF